MAYFIYAKNFNLFGINYAVRWKSGSNFIVAQMVSQFFQLHWVTCAFFTDWKCIYSVCISVYSHIGLVLLLDFLIIPLTSPYLTPGPHALIHLYIYCTFNYTLGQVCPYPSCWDSNLHCLSSIVLILCDCLFSPENWRYFQHCLWQQWLFCAVSFLNSAASNKCLFCLSLFLFRMFIYFWLHRVLVVTHGL